MLRAACANFIQLLFLLSNLTAIPEGVFFGRLADAPSSAATQLVCFISPALGCRVSAPHIPAIRRCGIGSEVWTQRTIALGIMTEG